MYFLPAWPILPIFSAEKYWAKLAFSNFIEASALASC